MKRICIIFLLSIIISLTAVGFCGGGNADNVTGIYGDYLRIHIRADSNDNAAQTVKYHVRDEVVKLLTPIVAECRDKQEAACQIQKQLPNIKTAAESVLRKEGFLYGAAAELTTEEFPTRTYGEYTLPKGEYTALIIRLGQGKGDNWWCVVYPPLCFSATENVVYKSKIAEIIENWKKG